MSATHRHDPRDNENDGNEAAFYAEVKPVPQEEEPPYRFPAMLTNGQSVRRAHRHLTLVKN